MYRSLCTALTAVLIAGVSAEVAGAQTVDEVIARNLDARGGVEKLRALTSTRATGDVVQGTTKIHVVTYSKRPNLMRREMEAPVPPELAARAGRAGQPTPTGTLKSVTGFDGTNVWIMNPGTGNLPQAVTGQQAELAKQGSEFDSVLLDYKAKGHTIELVGTENINGKPAYHLKVTRKQGIVQHYYLDTATGLEARQVATVEEGPIKAEVVIDFSNYQTVDGMAVPFTLKQSVNGKPVAEVTLSKWEANVAIDDALFRMPSKK
jgi:outer membrane lipoprotein-sorting protein